RLLQPKGIHSLPAGKLRHFALALLPGAAARRAVVARVRARRRSARFGLVGTPFLLQLRKRVLVEGARFAGARLLLDAAVLLGEILGRLVRRLLVGGPERNYLAPLELLLFLGRRNQCDGQPNLLLWRSSRPEHGGASGQSHKRRRKPAPPVRERLVPRQRADCRGAAGQPARPRAGLVNPHRRRS